MRTTIILLININLVDVFLSDQLKDFIVSVEEVEHGSLVLSYLIKVKLSKFIEIAWFYFLGIHHLSEM